MEEERRYQEALIRPGRSWFLKSAEEHEAYEKKLKALRPSCGGKEERDALPRWPKSPKGHVYIIFEHRLIRRGHPQDGNAQDGAR